MLRNSFLYPNQLIGRVQSWRFLGGWAISHDLSKQHVIVSVYSTIFFNSQKFHGFWPTWERCCVVVLPRLGEMLLVLAWNSSGNSKNHMFLSNGKNLGGFGYKTSDAHLSIPLLYDIYIVFTPLVRVL